MMRNYPLLLLKFISDKAKVSSLMEIVLYMNLEFYSLKRQEQLMKELEKDPLRACVKAINFCCIESQGDLQDFARNKLKELEDEIITKLKSAIKEIVDGSDEYSLLVNLKRLYELQLSRYVPLNSIYEDIVMVLRGFRNMEDELQSSINLNKTTQLPSCHALGPPDGFKATRLSSEALMMLLVSLFGLSSVTVGRGSFFVGSFVSPCAWD